MVPVVGAVERLKEAKGNHQAAPCVHRWATAESESTTNYIKIAI